MNPSISPSMPLRIGTPEEFSTLRGILQDSGFHEAAVAARAGVPSIFEFKTIHEGRETGVEIRDALDALIRLLMDGETLDQNAALLLPAGALESLEALDVVRSAPDGSGWYATVALYPVAGLYAASDRTFQPAGSLGVLPTDVVYAAITANTGRFLSVLPQDPCEAFLDVCAGTGIGAMVAGARFARLAWAADLGGRSVHFADFNRCLNGLDNVASVQGDLYEAIGDMTFDRIVAHPPYVPSKNQNMLFRDGGEDGEQILARIVQGLPDHLRPGGRFYCVTVGTDREGEPFEARIRRWLGAAGEEFDIFLVAAENRRRPEKFVEAVLRAKGGLGEFSETTQLFERLKVTGIFYGVCVVERRASSRQPLTARATKAQKAGTDAVEWFRRFESAAAEPGFSTFLLSSRPRLAPSMSLLVTHVPVEGTLMASKFEARASYPLVAEAGVESWVAFLLGACDGKRTGHEHFDVMKSEELIAPEMTPEDFAGVLRILLVSGFLEIEEFALPR